MTQDHLLSTDSIIEAAHVAIGAYDMVDDALRARIERLLDIFRGRQELTADQKIATRRHVVKLLSRRIGISHDIERHPEILDEKIEDPIFVIGFARTGTSIQQELLAADPANRAIVCWQTREPSPPPGERPVTAFRRKLAADDVQRFIEVTPGMLAMHPYWDKLDETLTEDEEVLALDFRNSYPTYFYNVPTLDYMLYDEDVEASYAFLKLFMQHQQWNTPKRRWVQKGVDHQRNLKVLFKVFPDARCLFIHRDPAEFLPSNMAVGAVVYSGISNGTLDRAAQGVETMKDYTSRIAAVLEQPELDDPRVTHIRFPEFIRDPVASLKACYAEWGFDWTDEGQAAMRAWLDDENNDGSRYGRQKYRFDAFGVDWEAESPAFDEYRRRYLTA